MTELRLAGATTIDDANRVLDDFLLRFNSRFKVPAQELEVAYRAVDEGMCLKRILCFKYRRRVVRDHTVRSRWHTLQLLPGTDQPSYAGAVVDVLEGLDGCLDVQHEERIIPSQEAPPRPSVKGGATMDHRGGEKLYHLAPLFSIEQPSYLSRCWDDRIPFLTCPHHAVEYGQQLPHARGEGYLLRFTGFQQALVELTQYRVATTGHQCAHIQRRAHRSSTAPHGPLASVRATVPIERRHTDQGSDLLAVQRAQFRQIREQCQRHLRSHAGNAAQKVILLTPYRTVLYPLSQVGVQVV